MEINWKSILEDMEKGGNPPLAEIKKHILENKEPANVTFGTSGWRGIFGADYTLYNVQRVSRAILDLYRNNLKELKDELGVSTFEEFKQKGVLIGHDARYLGNEFAKGVACVFQEAGVKTAYTGVATTPEFSASLAQKEFACAINLTPSHNPGNYGGYKFNPQDGGPASVELTSQIESNLKAQEFTELLEWEQTTLEPFDILGSYEQFYRDSELVDLDYCRELVQEGRIALVVDSVYGATKGRLKHLLQNPEGLVTLRTEDEPFFKGMEPEPSPKNMNLIKEALGIQKNPLKLGMIMDPDGDRVQFYDGESAIAMNQFGAIAFHYLAKTQGFEGGIARSVATSSFVDKIAEALGRPIYETQVGFKSFRKYLQRESDTPALICFEESDGISGKGHTLEKDAHLGCLLAIEIMCKTGESLTSYLNKLKEEFGPCYNARDGFVLDEKDHIEPKLVLKKISQQIKVGSSIRVGTEEKLVKAVVTMDGLKIEFEDASWFLVRPSGTEPKVRVYGESKKSEMETKHLYEAAKKLFFDVA